MWWRPGIERLPCCSKRVIDGQGTNKRATKERSDELNVKEDMIF
jgi:hypothetical protein